MLSLLFTFSLLTFIGVAGLTDLLYLQKWGEHLYKEEVLILSAVVFSIISYLSKSLTLKLILMFGFSVYTFKLGGIFTPAFFIEITLFLFAVVSVIKNKTLDLKPISIVNGIVFLLAVFLNLPKFETVKINYKENLPVKKLYVDLTCKHCLLTLKNLNDAKTYNLELILTPRTDLAVEKNLYLFCSTDKRKALQDLLENNINGIKKCSAKLKENTLLAILHGVNKLPYEEK